jgi:hypothetical protein
MSLCLVLQFIYCYAECRNLFIVMLNVIMLSVVMLSVIMLSVVAPNTIPPLSNLILGKIIQQEIQF